jgi:hypothetical protein
MQIIFFFFKCLLVYIYNIHARPFEEPDLNRLEIFNEITILISAYHLLAFTDWIPDSEEYSHIHENFGISMLTFTAINVIVNTSIMFVKTVKKLRMNCRRMMIKYQMWKKRRAQE